MRRALNVMFSAVEVKEAVLKQLDESQAYGKVCPRKETGTNDTVVRECG